MEESTFAILFSSLKGLQIDRIKLHNMLDSILLSICAVLCDVESWTEVAEFGQVQQDWLKSFLQKKSLGAREQFTLDTGYCL